MAGSPVTHAQPKAFDVYSADRLNVIVFNDFAHVNGGAAQVAIASAVGLADRGHNVTFFSAVPPIAPELRRPGLSVVLTDQVDIKSDRNRLRAATQGIWNRKAAAVFHDLLRSLETGTTVVHVHGWTKALTSSVIRVALHHQTPVLVTVHDYFYACPNGGFYDFPAKRACSLRALSPACLCRNCDRDGYAQKLWRSARQVVQNNFGFPPSDRLSFVTISDLSENIIAPYLPKNARVFRIPNPGDQTRESPVAVAANSDFVSVGRLSPEKGYALFAQAARQAGCQCTLVGEGPSRDEILRANPKAEITGWLDRESVRARLRTARALVFPSVWYEAQPLVIGEAAALGIPAIVSDGCAGREQIVDGQNGLLFRSGDVDDLAGKLSRMQDDSLVSRLGKQAYDSYWKSPPTLDRHLDLLEQCYYAVLREAASASAGPPRK